MDWIIRTFSSSIGKKQLMAVTGLGFLGFLAGHLAGNLTVYGGPDAFNSYANHLHSLGPLITVAEYGLLFFAVVHVSMGLWLFVQNLTARPVRYEKMLWAGGRTISSATMPYTGLAVLTFVVAHLVSFHFTPHAPEETFALAASVFSSPATIGSYLLAVVVLAFHVRHGLWSAFQTLGANHPKYTPAVELVSLAFALIAAVGFGFLPVVISLMAKGGY
ncbi:MAG: succinate dehydrogenase cytochrome b subunit [Thermodesulfobacteriota bacterium]